MKVSELLEARRANWSELDRLCGAMEGASRRKIPARTLTRFSTLYRAACADLALADAYQLPPGMVNYLHQLVGRAHNQLYRTRTFNMAAWHHELLVRVPQRLYADNSLRLAFFIFWGIFLLSMFMAYYSPPYAKQVMGSMFIEKLEEVMNKGNDRYGGINT